MESARAKGRRIRSAVILCAVPAFVALTAVTIAKATYGKVWLPDVLWALLATATAVGFGGISFIIRSNRILAYALIEISIGIAAVFFALLKYFGSEANAAIVPFMAGIYIIVRGLDNLARVIPETGDAREIWNAIFR